jgi:alpha-glucosidase
MQGSRRSLDRAWWRGAVLYQIYPRSFADADGDGVGDLQGVVDHLDHLAWLGVGGLWLNPITPSPNADWGYDVADYTAVDPALGDLDTVERLVGAAGERGIAVLIDLVPNHTSDRHPWFVDAGSSRRAPMRDRYVWAEPRPDGSPPNNWRSVFGGPAWTLDDRTGQYYLHNFLAEQPDLNWWSDDVRAEFDDVLRFWFDRGIAGFRIDVAHGLVKDRELRDNPPAEADDPPQAVPQGLRPVYNLNRPEVHDVYRRWRAIADAYDPPRVLIGETWAFDLDDLGSFYGADGDELDLAMNFPFVFSEPGPSMRAVVEETERRLPGTAWPTWAGSNHDVGRFPTRWCDGDERRVRLALLILLTLRGTPMLYYGDELGMPQAVVPGDRLLDPVGLRGRPDDPGRDGARTPMPWTAGPGHGFTDAGVEPWLPFAPPRPASVEEQRADPSSVLRWCRDVIATRRAEADLSLGPARGLDLPEPAWGWRRGESFAVIVDPSDDPVTVAAGDGEIVLATDRAREGRTVGGTLELEPWSGVVVRLDP